MIRIEINRETCNGYGNCVLAADGIFDLDDEGKVVLKQAEAGDDQADAVQRAVYDCPTDSISCSVVDDAPPQRAG
jgi:ferredoxin